MGVPVYMDLEDAYRIVTGYGIIQGIRGLFAILRDMEDCWDDLDRQERTACTMLKKDLLKGTGMTDI
jgi:hypothetical protein